MQCPHYLGRENYIVKCEFRDFVYLEIANTTQKIKTRCNGEYTKCKHYRLHKGRNNDIACPEFLHKSNAAIYCKNGDMTYSRKGIAMTYYMNKCCSVTGHKSCCNYPKEDIKMQPAEKKIGWMDSIYQKWDEDRKRKIIRMYRKGAV